MAGTVREYPTLAMPNGHAIWLSAGACTIAPPPSPRFGDLPPEHRKDIVRLGFLSAAAFAYTIAVCILAQPIPSRSLHTHVTLPPAAAPRSPLIEALLAEPAPPAPRPRMALATTTAARSGPGGLWPVAAAATNAPPQPRPERRGNVFSRFFKGVWRGISPRPAERTFVPVKAD